MTDTLIELAAEAAWKRDYPNGGSLYPTYESTNFQDKEIYRKEVAPIVAALHLTGSTVAGVAIDAPVGLDTNIPATTPLLPCPFCGNAAEITFWDNDEGTNGYYPHCSYCTCEIEGLYTREESITAWNKRAPVSQGEIPSSEVYRLTYENAQLQNALDNARAQQCEISDNAATDWETLSEEWANKFLDSIQLPASADKDKNIRPSLYALIMANKLFEKFVKLGVEIGEGSPKRESGEDWPKTAWMLRIVNTAREYVKHRTKENFASLTEATAADIGSGNGS